MVEIGKKIFLGVAFMSLFACIEDVDSSFNELETNHLLSLSGSKGWFLTSRSINGEVTTVSNNCDDNVYLVFANSTDEDSLYTLYMVEKIRYCEANETPDTVFMANYTLSVDVDDNFLDQIALSDGTGDAIVDMKVQELFTQELQISYLLDREYEVVDTYSYFPERLITTVEANKILSDYTTQTWSLDSRSEDGVDITLDACTDSKNLVFENTDEADVLYFIEQVSSSCEEGIEADTIITSTYILGGNDFDEFNGRISLEGESLIGVSELTSSDLTLVYIINGVTITEAYSVE